MAVERDDSARIGRLDIWQGVRMRDVSAGADPDAPPRTLTLPASWEDAAAEALAALAPGEGRVSLPQIAAAWIKPIAARAARAGDLGLGGRLHALLLRRQAAPTAPVWTGSTGGSSPGPLGYVLNLPAFYGSAGAAGFDVAGFRAAVDTAAAALRHSDPAPPRFAIAMADLDGLLAALGLDYDSEEARDVARCLSAVLRGRADAALGGDGEQPDLLHVLPGWPLPPASCAVPGLAEAAREARTAAASGPAGFRPCTAVLPAGPAEALLGVETGGIAPAFTMVRPGGGALTRAALARLAARSMTPDAALAATLRGEAPLQPASAAAHRAMHDAVAPYFHAMPPRPDSVPQPIGAAVPRRELPARRRGRTQKAAVGGRRVFLSTGEYADGTLGEVRLSLPREPAAVRALADAVCAAISLGLQHGVPLADYVDRYALTRFAPSGLVEGDHGVGYATSVLDWMVRHLAQAYLGGYPVPEAEPDPLPANDHYATSPLLPMDLPSLPPRAPRRTAPPRPVPVRLAG